MLTENVEIIGFTDRLDEKMEEWGNNFDVISHTKGSTVDHNGVYWKRQCERMNSGCLREKLRGFLLGAYKVWNGLFDTLTDMKGRHLSIIFEKTVGKLGMEMYRECLYI